MEAALGNLLYSNRDRRRSSLGGIHTIPVLWLYMISLYEIYQKVGPKQVRWVENANSLDDAKERLKEIATMFPGDYFILDVLNAVYVIPAES